jgi:signal transduction histidine kinase
MANNKTFKAKRISYTRVHGALVLLIVWMSVPLFAQKQMVQIKTFDHQLIPYKNVVISINGKDPIAMGNNGVAFATILDSDFPIKSIAVKDEKLEAASWNYSKGILEIIIRTKNYKMAQIIVRDQTNLPLPNLSITFNGRKRISATTNSEGSVQIPIGLDEKIHSSNQFSLPDFKITTLSVEEDQSILHVSLIKPELLTRGIEQKKSSDYFKDFELSKLDSIQSLTVFYAIFKNYQIKEMSKDARQKIDQKFNQLVTALQDSVRSKELTFIGKISDSSYVTEDIKDLLTMAEQEGKALETQRTQFDEKMQIIHRKLASGISNLDEKAREALLSDLTRLERLLVENEGRFYKNQNDYRNIINALKEKYFDVTLLENKLSESEAQRLEEQRAFRQKLIITLSILFVFSVLLLLLIYFSDKLKRQKKELVRANDEINRINGNLESLVAERTKLLEEANKELDTFLYRASHDLRSPVCSIIGLCNIALHLSNGESRDLVERVALTTSSMDKLLKKLCIISEINQPSNYSSITLLDLMDNIKQSFSKTFQHENIQFTMDCPADLVIFSYPNLIETILVNLLDNAIFYSVMKDPKNARVELTAAIKNNHVEISLYDNGIGIDEAITDRLFDMFFKGHVDSKGNGLGLYIVQKSVQALEGKIELQTEIGKFTRFIVQLPLNQIAFESTSLEVNPVGLQEKVI